MSKNKTIEVRLRGHCYYTRGNTCRRSRLGVIRGYGWVPVKSSLVQELDEKGLVKWV